MCNELQTPQWEPPPWRGRQVFEENRAKNLELLRQYEGKNVAWFRDGSGIRDADADSIALWERIRESGEDPCWYYYEHVEPPRAEGEPAPPPWWRSDLWLGAHFRMANRLYNYELLIPYDGKHVAWLPDGSGIRDADEDFAVLWDRIKESGDDPQWYCYEFYSSEPNV